MLVLLTVLCLRLSASPITTPIPNHYSLKADVSRTIWYNPVLLWNVSPTVNRGFRNCIWWGPWGRRKSLLWFKERSWSRSWWGVNLMKRSCREDLIKMLDWWLCEVFPEQQWKGQQTIAILFQACTPGSPSASSPKEKWTCPKYILLVHCSNCCIFRGISDRSWSPTSWYFSWFWWSCSLAHFFLSQQPPHSPTLNNRDRCYWWWEPVPEAEERTADRYLLLTSRWFSKSKGILLLLLLPAKFVMFLAPFEQYYGTNIDKFLMLLSSFITEDQAFFLLRSSIQPIHKTPVLTHHLLIFLFHQESFW